MKISDIVGVAGLVAVMGVIGTLGYTTYPTSPKREYVVYADGGGSVFEYMEKYNRFIDDGTTVKIAGPCASACTIVFSLPKEQICATPRATFGFHDVAVYTMMGGRIPMPLETKWMADYVYPGYIKDAFSRRGYDITVPVENQPFGMQWFTAEELGVRPCDG